jgi:flagellar hook-associated protein 1 FlgK
MSLTLTLSNALSGLNASQKALQVTSNNVANVNTEGYARKTVEAQSRVLAGFGAGVDIAAIERAVDIYLQRDLRGESATLGERQVAQAFHARIEEMFGTLGDDNAIGARITDLATALENVAANPEAASLRLQAVNEAAGVARQLNGMAQQVQDLRTQADREIADAIADINTQLDIVAELNKKIAHALSRNTPAEDLKDQRDLAVDRIASYLGIQYFERANGELVVMTRNGQTLVDGTAGHLSYGQAAVMTAEREYLPPTDANWPGDVPGIILNPVNPPDPLADASRDLTLSLGSGKLAGLVAMRDETLPDVARQIDTLAAGLRDTLNAVHSLGTPYPGTNVMTGGTRLAAGGTTVLEASGSIVVGSFDGAGVLSSATIALSSGMTVGQLVAAINGAGAGVTASIAGGVLELTAAPGSTVVVDDFDETTGIATSGVAIGGTTRSLSHALGLNDLFASGGSYGSYTSGTVAETTVTAGAGTLTLQTSAGTATVAYGAGQTLDQVAAAINAQAGGAGISASVERSPAGVRLRILGPDGDDTLLTDGGTLAQDLALSPAVFKAAERLSVRADILQRPDLLSRGTLRNDGTADYLSPGDDEIARRLAAAFTENLSFGSVGGLPAVETTLAGYGNALLSFNAGNAAAANTDLDYQETLFSNLKDKALSFSGVNLDEELSNMVLYQNSYQASARLVQAANEMFDVLVNLGL